MSRPSTAARFYVLQTEMTLYSAIPLLPDTRAGLTIVLHAHTCCSVSCCPNLSHGFCDVMTTLLPFRSRDPRWPTHRPASHNPSTPEIRLIDSRSICAYFGSLPPEFLSRQSGRIGAPAFLRCFSC